MKIIEFEIPDVHVVEYRSFTDTRGSFIKPLGEIARDYFEIDIKEIYFSISHKNVLRGLHFQTPPFDHDKFIFLTRGRVYDVILDLRKNSSHFKKYISLQLKALETAVFIPKGCAHGFLSLEQNTTMVYNLSTYYNKEKDEGILWSSIDVNWGTDNPIVSERDTGFPELRNFNSPF